ncbi:hydrogenase maturation nickel metallochaperone HypA [Alisedimentitalea sp. MJ-SS2]|uniref:hydrogenase maturation nickel metallochaperone HypA n=1 Tax=Aliisedimentitalea sp. MJ-SS2 TaxID=3049795 RepID=UPI002910933C|nr:hydrogenase maturation nickel metallochaperone HypA [Alisedimentitalea sp. MJ-SS2]MDU8929653.1 hydrogenase maturation nickel metallochaperone HypA [Alisedimentitalea sp. MJ-SS2]
MHEMSICESIVSVIEEQAMVQSFDKVNMVRLEVGALAGVELEALKFSFDVVTRGSIAEGATLDVIELPVSGWCMPCAKAITVRERYDACADCGSYQIQITGGDELRIKEMEVD